MVTIHPDYENSNKLIFGLRYRHEFCQKKIFKEASLNPYLANVSFLFLLKASENQRIFLYFQEK